MIAAGLILLAAQAPGHSPRSIYQIGTFEALKRGDYDGRRPIGGALAHGGFGLGTLNALDGEIIVLDGKIYHGDAFGDLDQPPVADRAPFACVVRFQPDLSFRVDRPLSAEELQRRIDQVVMRHFSTLSPSLSLQREREKMLAIRIDGRFSDVVSRAFPPQMKPYLPFAKISGREARFSYPSVEGTFVGFRLPTSIDPVNVPGYHFHFVNTARTRGGHVLVYRVEKAVVRIMLTDKIVR